MKTAKQLLYNLNETLNGGSIVNAVNVFLSPEQLIISLTELIPKPGALSVLHYWTYVNIPSNNENEIASFLGDLSVILKQAGFECCGRIEGKFYLFKR